MIVVENDVELNGHFFSFTLDENNQMVYERSLFTNLKRKIMNPLLEFNVMWLLQR